MEWKMEMSQKFSGKWRTESLNTNFPFTDPAICGLEREIDLIYNIFSLLIYAIININTPFPNFIFRNIAC